MPARRKRAAKFEFATGVRVVSIPGGAIVSAPAGCFRLPEAAAELFFSDVIPALCRGESAFRERSPKWIEILGPQLSQAGIIAVSADGARSKKCRKRARSIALSFRTPLALNVLSQLVAHDFEPTESLSSNSLVVSDLSSLDVPACLEVVREVFQTGAHSLCIWKRGAESFYGPICTSRSGPCWNCARLRFADSISENDIGDVKDDSRVARSLARNILLASYYREIAAFGCLIIDDGKTSSLHSVAPVPWCEICGGVADTARLAQVTHSPYIPDNFRSLADPRCGIIRQLFISDGVGISELSIPKCSSVSIAPFRNGAISNPASNGEGKGASQEESVWSAIGEGLERYSGCLWDPHKLIQASFRQLGGRAFDPRWLVLYEDEKYADLNFAYARFTEDSLVHWTIGKWLDTGDEVRVPASATYMNFPLDGKERFCQTTSSGLAAGRSFEDAALRSLYELIERDSFMIYWMAKRPGLRIDPTDCDEITCSALDEIGRLDVRIELFLLDLQTKHPTVVCLGLGNGRIWPSVTIGLATHADIDIAIRKAVLEHGHYGAYLRGLMRERRHRNVRNRADVRGNLDHGLFYIHPKNISCLRFFRGGRTSAVALAELRSKYRQEATLSGCVSSLGDAGIRTAAVDVTSPDVALSGIRVVRAFGINMQPIHFGFGYERCENPRLEQFLTRSVDRTPHPVA